MDCCVDVNLKYLFSFLNRENILNCFVYMLLRNKWSRSNREGKIMPIKNCSSYERNVSLESLEQSERVRENVLIPISQWFRIEIKKKWNRFSYIVQPCDNMEPKAESSIIIVCELYQVHYYFTFTLCTFGSIGSKVYSRVYFRPG